MVIECIYSLIKMFYVHYIQPSSYPELKEETVCGPHGHEANESLFLRDGERGGISPPIQ